MNFQYNLQRQRQIVSVSSIDPNKILTKGMIDGVSFVDELIKLKKVAASKGAREEQ